MRVEANFIEEYKKADAAEKVEIICKNYPNFIGIIDGQTEGLCYMILNERLFHHGNSQNELGVRVQTSGLNNDVTANAAINNVVTKQAVIDCDFSGGVLEGLESKKEYEERAIALRRMRMDYELFRGQLGSLPLNDSRIFLGYLSGNKSLEEIASEEHITYNCLAKRIRKIKFKIKVQMVEFINGIV